MHGAGVEVPEWMFDTAVCCQMRMAQTLIATIDALRKLNALCTTTRLQATPGGMLLHCSFAGNGLAHKSRSLTYPPV